MNPTIALCVALFATMLIALTLGVMCYVTGRDNDRLRRVAWNRLKTANRLRNLRLTHRLLEDFVNDPIGDEDGQMLSFPPRLAK